MTPIHTGRRRLLAGSGAALAVAALGGLDRPTWTGRQFHNQPVDSHLHPFLVNLWAEVARRTNGRLVVTVFAQNDQIPGSDPAALELLRQGGLQFFALMGGILSKAVPAADIQGLPYAFKTHAQVHAVNDGALGAYLGRECAAKGIHRFQYGLMENGFRQVGMIDQPIRTAEDLSGRRIRVPDGEMFRDTFAALGATPVTVNINGLYDALKTRRVDGQENPLVVTEFNRLYEVTHNQSLTNHMWSGFNLIANLGFWNALPADVQRIVDAAVKRHVARQRAFTDSLNRRLQTTLAQRGQIFNAAEPASFRERLGADFYRRWRAQLGETGWTLLEKQVGRLGPV